MAITAVTSCLGPPPLPPGKRFLQKSSKKLSSTYRSFRDPAVESWIPSTGVVLEMSKTKADPRERSPVIRAISNGNLFRSCSEGNLSARKTSVAVFSSTPLDKCIQAIYGSWKNLMHRKCSSSANVARLVAVENRSNKLRDQSILPNVIRDDASSSIRPTFFLFYTRLCACIRDLRARTITTFSPLLRNPHTSPLRRILSFTPYASRITCFAFL